MRCGRRTKCVAVAEGEAEPERAEPERDDADEAGMLLSQIENPVRPCLSWVDLAFLRFDSGVGSSSSLCSPAKMCVSTSAQPSRWPTPSWASQH